MLTFKEVEEKTAPIFKQIENLSIDSQGKSDPREVVPEPSLHWKRKIEALEEASLMKQRAAAIFDMRCEQAATMGFQRITSTDMITMLMGEESTDNFEADAGRQTHEWFYNHHTGVTLEGSKCTWGGKPQDYVRKIRSSLKWHWPPFGKEEVWRCRFGKLDYLKREIPYGVILRIQELKKLNLFNAFNVIAPIEAWERETDIDPIVVAAIWELPPTNDGSGTAGQVAHFFLAQW